MKALEKLNTTYPSSGRDELNNIDLVILAQTYDKLVQFKQESLKNGIALDKMKVANSGNGTTLNVVLNRMLELAEAVLKGQDLGSKEAEHYYDEQDLFWKLWAATYSYFWVI